MKILATTPSLWCFLITILISGYATGQDYSEKYLISDGLPSQEIYDIHQDKNGVLWIASDRGIASFNGSNFTSYGMIDGFPSNMVFEFFEQPDGTIWCTTRENELFFFHPDTLEFQNYKYNHVLLEFWREFRKLEPRALVVSDDGGIKYRSLWKPEVVRVSAEGKLLYKYGSNDELKGIYPLTIKRDETGYPYVYSGAKPDELYKKGFGRGNRQHLLELENTYVWLTEFGYQILLKNNLEVIEYQYLGKEAKILNSGTCKEGFWIGLVHGGVQVFDEKGNLKKHMAKEYSVTTYFEDSDRGIWLGTHGTGLLYYAESNLKVLQPSLHTKVYSLSIDRNDHLMYMTNDHNQVKVDRYLNYVSSEKVNWNKSLGQYFFSTNTFYDNPPEELEVKGRIMRYPDDRHSPPLFVFGSGVYDEDLKLILSNTGDEGLISDAEYSGNSVIIALGEKIIKVDRSGKIISKKDLGAEVNDLDVGSDGMIYCATRWKGVIVLNQNLQIVSKINTSTGTLGNYAFEVLLNDAVLWIGSENGLSKATKGLNNNWKIENLGVREGLPDLRVYDIEIVNGRVYLATREGITYFEKKDWKKVIKEEIKLHFKKTKLSVNGIQREDLLDLAYNENQIQIGYELVTFANSRKLNFRYKLIGFDNTWRITSERKVIYHSLPPGSYEFVIQPIINGNPRGAKLKEKIEIHPAFYNEWWFHLTIWSTVIFIIWLFFKYRILKYNRGVIQEILRQIMRRMRPASNEFIIRSNGKDIRIISEEIIYVESSSNYITIYTEKGRHIVRHKISEFTDIVPDPIEYLRIKRSIIIRIDKVTAKGVNSVIVGDEEFKVGKTYLENLKKIEL